MNNTQKGIVLLLKSAVTGEKLDLPEGFQLEAEDTRLMIKKHQLVPLVYVGGLNCGLPSNSPMMQSLFKGYCKYMIHGERQMAAADQVFAEFEKYGIDYMPFKGYCMKKLYPKPEMRIMGDVDVLIRREDSKDVMGILGELGYKKHTVTDNELVYDSANLHLEVHKRLFTPLNEAYYEDVWSRAKRVDGHRYEFSVEDTWIYLFNHFARHYAGGGIGCRHVIDLYVYRQAFPDMNEAYIVSELKKMRLDRFYAYACRLLDVWFENAEPDASVDDKVALLTETIFDSGAWGSVASNAIAYEASKAEADKAVTHVKSKAILRSVLPPRKILQNRYPVLKKWPVLLPVLWVVRGVRVALFQHDDIKRQQKKWNSLEDGKVDDYRDCLAQVGLDHSVGEK